MTKPSGWDGSYPKRASWLFVILLLAAAALVLRFVVLTIPPYLSWSPDGYGPAFWPRRYALVLHLTGGLCAILTGPVQLWLGETRRARAWHSVLGYLYLGGVLTGVLGGYDLAFTAVAAGGPGWAYAFGLIGLSTAWTVTTALAFLAIRRRRIVLHREWMIRSFVVTMAFVFFRLFDEVAARAGFLDATARAVTAAWLCWAVPLLVAEPVIQWHRFQRAASSHDVA
jgi:hypothetical protein